MTAFPGFSAPAAGFDEPLAMLHACHDRVRRSCDLLMRLVDRVAEGRIDDAVRSAARDVLRYFDIAAPLHHDDEEKHIFPLLLERSDDTATRDAVRRLQADHVRMLDTWARLRGPLAALAGGDDAALDAAARETAAAFVALYDGHAATEESLVFPAAAALLDDAALAGIGSEMAARRGVAAR